MLPTALIAQIPETLISQGNSYLSSKEYGKAWACYADALILDNSNNTAISKINQIENTLKDKQLRLSLFETNITSGAELMGAGDTQGALLAYKAAALLRPESGYPKGKINEITATNPDPVIEKGYNNAIAKGDRAFDAQDYQNARKAYNIALSIKELEAYPTEKLQEIEKKMGQSEQLQNEYDGLIKQADDFASAGKDLLALEKYRAALEIFPSESYPQQKVTSLSQKIAQKEKLSTQYQDKITQADNLYMGQQYEAAKSAYREAQKIKPGESYPGSMIARIEEALLKQQSQRQQYNKLVQQGDMEKASGNRAGAITKYKQASAMFPEEEYPKDMIAAIEQQQQKEVEAEKAFNDALSAGDQAFQQKKYQDAAAQYTMALALQPDNTYARDKVAEVNGLIAENEAKEKAWDAIINDARNLYNKKEYAEALGKYRTAAQMRPQEQEPVEKIKELETVLAEMAKTKKEYDKIIAKADKSFRTGDFTQALAEYNQALKLLPNEKHPSDQIININNKLQNEAAAREAQYNQLVSQAEEKAQQEQYGDAIALYSEAGKLIPDNNTAQNRIAELEKSMEAAGQRDEAFNKIIARADTHMTHDELREALDDYNEALKIKPGDTYAINKRDEIQIMLVNREKEKQEQFEALIKQGELSMQNADYPKAMQAYSDAATIFPDDENVKSKIAEIKSLSSEADAKEAEYLKAISKADKLLKNNELNQALKAFQAAGDLKPSEAYPKMKVLEINNLMAEQQRINNQYNALIKKADQFYASLAFDEAAEKYREAQDIKPEEPYPTQQINEIQALKKDIAQKDRSYEEKISLGDRMLADGHLEKAKNAFEAAQKLKPNETYPGQQLATINDQLKQLEEKNQAYAEAMQSGDELFEAQRYNEALEAFNHALEIIPGDDMAKRKISSTQKLIDNQASIQSQYESTITKADKAFNDNDFQNAKKLYSKAVELMPDKEYAKTKLSETNGQIELQEQQRRIEYDKTVETADGFFSMGQYSAALEKYKAARMLLSSESYPQEKIKETQAIILEQKSALLGEYRKLISQADVQYKNKKYAGAIINYEKAGNLNTGEQYPFQMINNIKTIIANQVTVNINVTQPVIEPKEEVKMRFAPLHYSQKKENYIVVTAKRTSEDEPKVYLNFGLEGQKNGGIVINNILSPDFQEYIIPVSGMDGWYRKTNNWISVYCVAGSIEIHSVTISNIVE